MTLSGRRLALVVVGLFAVAGAARSSESPDVASMRRTLARIAAQLRDLEVRSDSLRAAEERVALDLAALEREENLGPMKRAQLSVYRQESEKLTGSRRAIDRARDELEHDYRDVAEELLPLLQPVIEAALTAYEAEPDPSPARAGRFREYRALVRERRHLEGKLYRTASFIRLDIEIGPDDTLRDLERKVDLLADNRDLHALLLSGLSRWKRELEHDRTVLADYLELREELALLHTTDPTDLPHIRDLTPGLSAADVVPPELGPVESWLDIPHGGLATEGDYDRLLESVNRVETTLEEEILAMNENQRFIEREIARLAGVE